MENQEVKRILEELRTIRIDIEFIKGNMLDSDILLTCNEKSRLDESIEEFKKGKSISLKDIENA
jgi:hypothetical protein